MTAAQAVRMEVPPVDRYDRIVFSSEQKRIESYATLVTGIKTYTEKIAETGMRMLHREDTRDLSKIQELIDLHRDAAEILRCLQCEIHGQEV